jgi:Dyp-type peroxidase family
MENLDLTDLQGLIKRGYQELPYSNILLLRVADALLVKHWLQRLLPAISRGDIKDRTLEINIAFTFAGLAALGLPSRLQKRFSREFEEGMSEDSRSRLLGDYDRKANRSTVPQWDWRDGEGDKAVHLLLLIYGREEHLVENYCAELQLGYPGTGLQQISKLATIKLEENREHFGFQDGISQPHVAAFGHRNDTAENTVALGEFLLGYPNQYGKLTASPTVTDPHSGQEWDFGKNGTYLVMRQLEQDVQGFWQYMADHSRHPDGSPNVAAAIALAAKMVGRWPSGAPLPLAPDQDIPDLANKNSFRFEFHKKENYGKCPVGAHIARVNPRDALAKDPQKALKIASHHRILRRGRPYGRPFITSMEPEALFRMANATGEERGLHFICLNANISRQFEFIQSTWIHNKKFNGLYDDADPVSGTQESDFLIPQRPVCRHLKAIPAFVKVKGGGYFFMPSHAALKFLAEN